MSPTEGKLGAAPYYQDDLVTLYHGDCLVVRPWLEADVLLTDPPYGLGWRQGALKASHSDAHPGIAGDLDTTARDEALVLWGNRPAIVFGSLALAPPVGTKQVLVYRKPPNAGTRGAMGYHRAGFDVVGIDIVDQPHYPFEFHLGDALDLFADPLPKYWQFLVRLHEIDVIHASPPCQPLPSGT